MQPKRYALTQLGGPVVERRAYVRRDANCPVIAHVGRSGAEKRTAVPCWMVNICEDGCLITSDSFPPNVADVYIIIPGLGAKVHGQMRNQGDYTLNLKFTTLLTPDVVDTVARITLVPKS